ncbi:MAG: hypothetical protein ACR2PX_25240 [Endozoicomonas sp.]|uniref:hypothetical protein n=1 Tax=Endozoicomonas sp. TaxID=1892382 RepID=UPI003D9AC28F
MSIGGTPPEGPVQPQSRPGPKKSSSSEGKQRGRKLTARSSQKERWMRDAKTRKDSRHFSSYETEALEPEEVDPQLTSLPSDSDKGSKADKRHGLPHDPIKHQDSKDSGIDTLTSTSSYSLELDDIEEEMTDSVFLSRPVELSDKNRKSIEDGFKNVASELYHIGMYEVSELPKAMDAFRGYSSSSISQALESVDLESYWAGVCDSAIELLEWAGKGKILTLPESLIQAARKKEVLDSEAGEAFSQVIDADGTLKRSYYKNKAVRLRKASNDFVVGAYSREFKGFQRALTHYISDQPASIRFHEYYDELRESLYENFGLSAQAGIVSTVEKEWVRNILMRRAIAESSIAGTGLL